MVRRHLRSRLRLSAQGGHAMVLALFVVFLTMAAGALLAGSLDYRMRLLREEVQDVHLTAISDAGLALALDRLSLTPFWSGTVEREVGEGTVSVTVGHSSQIMVRQVDVTALYGTGGRSLRAKIQLSDYYPPRVVSWEPRPYNPPRGEISADL